MLGALARQAAPSDRPSRALDRELAQWHVYVPFYARALALQGSHPVVAASLVQHSTVFDDPIGRAVRTTSHAMRLLYGDDRADAARELRALHHPIGGVGFDGHRYHAWDREVWTWVHLTTVEAMLYGAEVCCGPVDPAVAEAFYADCRRTGLAYGVRRADMPEDVADLRAYVADGVDRRLVANPGTERLRRAVLAGDLLGRLPVSSPVRRLSGRALAVPLRVLVFGAFPDAVRRLWRVEWSPLDEQAYRSLLLGARLAAALLPDRVRMVPAAHRALHPRPGGQRGGGIAGAGARPRPRMHP